MSKVILVKAVYDAEAGVWLTESADIHGLRIEAPTLDRLMDCIPGAVEDMLEGSGETGDIAIEVIAHATTWARLGLAA